MLTNKNIMWPTWRNSIRDIWSWSLLSFALMHYSVVHSSHKKSFSESKKYTCILNILYNTEFHTSYFHFREKLIARKWAPSICWRGRFLHIQGDTRLISQNVRFPLPDIPHWQSKCWKYWAQSAKRLSNSQILLSSTILANVLERDNTLNDVQEETKLSTFWDKYSYKYGRGYSPEFNTLPSCRPFSSASISQI